MAWSSASHRIREAGRSRLSLYRGFHRPSLNGADKSGSRINYRRLKNMVKTSAPLRTIAGVRLKGLGALRGGR
jgi:hypothetical protein